MAPVARKNHASVGVDSRMDSRGEAITCRPGGDQEDGTDGEGQP